MRKTLLVLALLGFAAPASAADISTEVMVRLQVAMQEFIDERTVDGAYSYIDAESAQLRTVYPANVHPMVLAYGDDYFVCSELVDETGENLTADFLVRQIGDEYRVVQFILDDRPLVSAAMSKGGG